MFRKGHVSKPQLQAWLCGKGVAKVPTEKGDFTFSYTTPFLAKGLELVVICKKRHAECRLMDVLEQASEEVALDFQPIPSTICHIPY